MKTVTARELATWLADDRREKPLLLDVREPWETQICRIDGSELVPMQALAARLPDFAHERPIVCICHHGGRSAHVAMFLARHGYESVYNLTGGVDAWARQVDATMPTY
ncbi:MAG TPA: rhodanese-like domain-containing protein [Burkholderiaceae bacterium]|jgi:rhodanese-related sulfurtransferase|nr:rhodanese-like domain-containing protein [Burkholderiaceae bacterium]HQR77292.1 rhodanese-like domain-containing protein [Burkholderiaceae bacterium]